MGEVLEEEIEKWADDGRTETLIPGTLRAKKW